MDTALYSFVYKNTFSFKPKLLHYQTGAGMFRWLLAMPASNNIDLPLWTWELVEYKLLRFESSFVEDMRPESNQRCMREASFFKQVASPTRQQLLKELQMQKLRDKTEKLKADILEQVGTHLNEAFDNLIGETESLDNSVQSNGDCGDMVVGRSSKQRNAGELPDKQYVSRRSLLTELFEINHIRTIYHIFVAILILFSLNTIVYDLIETGRFTLDFGLIQWALGKFPVVMFLWSGMMLSTMMVVFTAFQHWAYHRSPSPIWQRIDYLALTLYILYQCAFLVVPVYLVHIHQLPPASTTIIACEQIRQLMKAHSFVRENISRAVNYKPKKEDSDDVEDSPCPDFSYYLYFLFAPTLIYRDNYPRTAKINWNYVATNLAQVVACLFYTYYIFMRFCVPVFQHFNQEHVNVKNYILAVFGCMLPGTLVLFIGFFMVLHSWLNAFAEMLRFSDRMFYKDWWNSTSFSNYYRTWNVVVHDWLYTYVYKDFYRVVGQRHRPLAMMLVFVLSAVFHEYILVLSFGFFYPVLFFMFAGCGFGFIFLTHKRVSRTWNVFMWVALFIGNGMLMCLYSMEYYAQKNCPPYMNNVWDLVIPRSWVCQHAANVTTTT